MVINKSIDSTKCDLINSTRTWT